MEVKIATWSLAWMEGVRVGWGGRGCALHNAERSGSPALCAWAPASKLTIGAYRLERFSNSKSVIDRPSAIKLKRTETTLDLSQKAEKGMLNSGVKI